MYGHGKEIKPPDFRSQKDIEKIAVLERRCAKLEATIKAREKECDREHYHALEGCLEELSLTRQHNKELENDCKLYKNSRDMLEQRNRALVEALEHIVEYWNRNENPGAMSDALWHILEIAEQTLA